MVITLPKKATYNCIKTTEQSALSATHAMSSLTGSSHKHKTSSLKNRPASEKDTVLQSKFSMVESSAKSTCSTNKISTMYLLTSRRHLTGHAALWATMRKHNIGVNLVRVIEHFYDKPPAQSSLMAPWGNGFAP